MTISGEEAHGGHAPSVSRPRVLPFFRNVAIRLEEVDFALFVLGWLSPRIPSIVLLFLAVEVRLLNIASIRLLLRYVRRLDIALSERTRVFREHLLFLLLAPSRLLPLVIFHRIFGTSRFLQPVFAHLSPCRGILPRSIRGCNCIAPSSILTFIVSCLHRSLSRLLTLRLGRINRVFVLRSGRSTIYCNTYSSRSRCKPAFTYTHIHTINVE